MDALTEHQRKIADYALAEEGRRRDHLVVALSGAHAYGFASENSDLDLKAIHIAPTESLLGLAEGTKAFDRLEVINGVEIDYTSNELGVALRGVLAGGGNMIERILAPDPLVESPELEGLRAVTRANLSRRIYNHYRGFATSQSKAYAGSPTIKKLLYVLRTALTGAHALETGAVVPDLSALADDYGFPEARGLIAMKRAEEQSPVPESMRSMSKALIDRAFARLDQAKDKSVLPEEPADSEGLERWLVATRIARINTARA